MGRWGANWAGTAQMSDRMAVDIPTGLIVGLIALIWLLVGLIVATAFH